MPMIIPPTSPTTHVLRVSLRARLYRDIEIRSNASLYDLAEAIVRAFAGDSHIAVFRHFRVAARRLIGFQRWDSTKVSPHGRVHRLFLRSLRPAARECSAQSP